MNTERPAGLDWIKSTYSGDEGGECVEVAAALSAVLVRDSKERGGPQLAFARDAWTGFLFDLGQGKS
ncbi:DUF397 domain-containing protein [Streptomyces sp. NBC_00184]|uniref:DUF397 domain-containing protein n=1 Tax=Streptomyces sp. NBC_00184 TaxID=2975673 RepID=UPI002E2B5137|nr:DUF397 domain-containing protein [Streptomyces sp. NBC_00184]